MHANTKLFITLTKEDLKIIRDIIKKGYNNARVITRARVLYQFYKGKSSPKVAEYCGVSHENLNYALFDKPRSGKKKTITEQDAASVIALACTDPPEGYARWTIRLLAMEVVKRSIVDNIGRESVRIILKSHALKPWREKNVVYS